MYRRLKNKFGSTYDRVKHLRVQVCDRRCESCPLLKICGGIEQYGILDYRCLYAGCKLKAPAIKRMQECNVCIELKSHLLSRGRIAFIKQLVRN